MKEKTEAGDTSTGHLKSKYGRVQFFNIGSREHTPAQISPHTKSSKVTSSRQIGWLGSAPHMKAHSRRRSPICCALAQFRMQYKDDTISK